MFLSLACADCYIVIEKTALLLQKNYIFCVITGESQETMLEKLLKGILWKIDVMGILSG